jgi:hypothetical protein
LVLSPVDTVIAWAEGLFAEEPWLMPRLIGRAQVPKIDDHGRALREPHLAVLSAVFHGPHEHGIDVVLPAALALRTLPLYRRYKYIALLEDVLPEEMMTEVRRISLEEAQTAADDWMRSRGPYVIGHREGVEEGREEGREEGLLHGRREALAWILDARGLVLDSTQHARIAVADLTTLERWCTRAKTAHSIADIFD